MSEAIQIEQLKAAALRGKAHTTASNNETLERVLAAIGAEFLVLTIPTTAWTDNSDATLLSEGLSYQASVAVAGITASYGADTEIALESRAAAKACGLASIAHTQTDSILYYAVEIPTETLTLQVGISTPQQTEEGTS